MTRTILLADDSVTIQKVVELTFLDEDFRVVAVGNGSDAIERLGDLRPDLVLADVHMPGADGYEVAAAVRERLAGVPVLLLVGTFEIFDSVRAGEVGATGHLKKPFDSQELLRQVKDLLAQAPPAPAVPVTAEPVARVESPAAAEPIFDELPSFEPVGPATTGGEDEDGGSWSFEPSLAPPEPEAPPPVAAEAGAEPAVPAVAVDEPWAAAPEPEFEVIDEAEPEAELESEAEPVEPAAEAPPEPSVAAAAPGLSDEDVDRIARRMLELIGERVVRDVAWEVVPDLAEVLLKARIRELEASVE
jgi:CheY-like chemotaxis protein